MPLLSECSIDDFKATTAGINKEKLENQFPSSISQAVNNMVKEYREGRIEFDSVKMGFVQHRSFHAIQFIVDENQTSKRDNMLLVVTRLNELENEYSSQKSDINSKDKKGSNSIKYIRRDNKHVIAHNHMYKGE